MPTATHLVSAVLTLAVLYSPVLAQPKGDFSVEWQSYFEVPTAKLPNITGTLPRNFAGNIPVNRSSGMIALTTENGPIQLQPNGTWFIDELSWNTLADTIWIGQPVGTGFSTSDSKGYVPDEDQTAEDFVGFLSNLVKVFPSLATRPLFLTGESYAGVYIPYIIKHIFQTPKPPVTVKKFAIGNGSLGSRATIRHLPIVGPYKIRDCTTLKDCYVVECDRDIPSLIGYDQQVFEFFREHCVLVQAA
ncbi:Alpha/Beta hydrolase protein [Mycena rebaudengoi]|nr:Alpha/Beta hydrolase protein [Mycena rebaudengoi]